MARRFFLGEKNFGVLKPKVMSVHPFSFSNGCLLLLSAGLGGYLFFLWRRVQQKAAPSEIALFKKPVQRFALVYALFLAVISLLASTDFFTAVTVPPRFLIVFLPLLFFIVLLCKASTTGALRFLYFLPPAFLLGVHVYRTFIEIIFIRLANEKIIPVQLSINGRNLDLWIGVLAIPVALLFHREHRAARPLGLLFNFLGLLSLANIFSIVIQAVPSPFRRYDTLFLPTYFPGVLIVFLASAAILLHILSLKQLMAIKKKAANNTVKQERVMGNMVGVGQP